MQRLLSFIVYLASFGVARGSLFVAPILLANLLSPREYGALEFAQAVAAVAAPLLACGTAGVVPLVLVRKVDSASWRAILLHQAAAVILLTGVALIAVIAEFQTAVWLAALVTSAIMLQSLWSVALKSQGRGEASLFMDAGFWVILALAVMAPTALSALATGRWNWVVATLSAYVLSLAAWTIWNAFKSSAAGIGLRYMSTLRTGLPLMFASLLALLATTSGRLGIGLLSTPETVADYAILFRATALPVVIHQVIVLARYRQIFELSATALEKKLPMIVGAVIVSAIAFWLLSDLLSHLLGSAFSSAFARHRTEGLLILSQCVLWSAVALNDLVNARSQTAGPVVKATLWYFVLALPLAWWFLAGQPVTLSLYVPVHSLIMCGYFVTQAVVMWRNGVKLKMTWTLALLGFFAMSSMSLLA
jgi:O-antigen/teichoic acid export membrane protein